MRTRLAGLALAVAIGFGATAAQAFECPAHFAEAEQAIADATAAMENMSGDHGLVHTLIDDAKMWLESGKHNHSKPAAGGYDHARAIAKADAAAGYANAAKMLAEK